MRRRFSEFKKCIFVLIIACSLLAPSNLLLTAFGQTVTTPSSTLNPQVKQASVLSISCNATVLDLGTSTVPSDFANVSGVLSAGGVPLSGKSVIIFWRISGGVWGAGPLLTTDSLGRYFTLVPANGFGPGSYDFKATFDVAGLDADYASSNSSVVTLTIVAPIIVTVNGGLAFVNDTAATGITVEIQGSSLPNGTVLIVYIAKLNSTQPVGTGAISIGGAIFYDIKVTDNSGNPLASDVMVTITITDSNIVSSSVLFYWGGLVWVPVTTTFIAPHTISFTVSASVLGGTPIVIYPINPFEVPEYFYGALMSLAACFLAYIIIKRVGRKQLYLRP
jgi:hypothetical protein